MRFFSALLLLAACDAKPVETRLSLPIGGRAIQGPAPATVPGRVETASCYAGRAPAELASSVAAGLRADWGDVRVVPRPGHWVVVGERDGLGLAGVVAPGGPCAAGEVWVSIGAQPAGTPGGTVAGPAGPRRHAATRLPVVPSQE